ncbi:hypothetical protein Q3G72_002524 [Acer saccharum]|nr:hypothetical protein Q3G72_002524 [Acer saccharum]
MLGIARIEKSSIEWGGKDRSFSFRRDGPLFFLFTVARNHEEAGSEREWRLVVESVCCLCRGTTILDWPPSHGLERKRSPCYYKASKLLPQDTVALPMGTG